MIIVNKVDDSYNSLAKQYPDENIVILNDNAALFHDEYEDSVAWLNESPSIIEAWSGHFYNTKNFFRTLYSKIEKGETKFKTLYTHDKRYQGLPNVKHVCPATPSWISKEESGVHPKVKNLTFITTDKIFTAAQEARVYLARKMIDAGYKVYGKGYEEVDKKAEVLKDYRFCFAVENGSYPGYHSEKILDCFRMGVVPIYWGDTDIDQLFNPAGIIRMKMKFMESMDFNMFTEEIYDKMMPAIIDNYNRALEYDNSSQSVMEQIVKDQT